MTKIANLVVGLALAGSVLGLRAKVMAANPETAYVQVGGTESESRQTTLGSKFVEWSLYTNGMWAYFDVTAVSPWTTFHKLIQLNCNGILTIAVDGIGSSELDDDFLTCPFGQFFMGASATVTIL